VGYGAARGVRGVKIEENKRKLTRSNRESRHLAKTADLLIVRRSGRLTSYVLGKVIGNFRVISLLGRGGMGEVYVAEHVGIQTRVAIKVLLPEISKNADHVHRLFNEARIVSRIKHAGITKIFDVGFLDGQAYLVMEYLEGEALARRIARGRLSIGEVAEYGRQVASVLAATHASGVTHRDLKPDNIFLVGDAELERHERVKVLDFGIAKLSGSGGPRTIGTMGTPEYMAPEQWGDSGSVDWRADAYSLGCVLFEMVAGRPPFPSTTIAEAYTHHTQSVPPALRTLVADVPVEIDRLIQQLLAKDPAARGDSMLTIARALEPWVSATTSSSADRSSGELTPRFVTTLGGGAGEIRRVDNVKRTGIVAAATALAAIVAIAVFSGHTGHASNPVHAASAPNRAAEPVPQVPVHTTIAPNSAPPVLHVSPVVTPAPKPAVPKLKPTSKPQPKPAPAKLDELEGRT
jgi:serine/threonine protein kinase